MTRPYGRHVITLRSARCSIPAPRVQAADDQWPFSRNYAMLRLDVVFVAFVELRLILLICSERR